MLFVSVFFTMDSERGLGPGTDFRGQRSEVKAAQATSKVYDPNAGKWDEYR